MTDGWRTVADTAELLAALAEPNTETVTVTGTLGDVPMIELRPGQALIGADAGATIRFKPGADGVKVSTDNSIGMLRLRTEPARRAVFNDTSCATLGNLVLRDLHLDGCVEILAEGAVLSGHVEARNVKSTPPTPEVAISVPEGSAWKSCQARGRCGIGRPIRP